MNTRYILYRAVQALITIFVVVTLTFALIRLLPGGPMDFLRAELLQSGIASDEIDAIIAAQTNVHPDKPILDQYVNYIGSLLQGDLGQSVYHNEPVASIIARTLPWTIFLMVTSIFLIYAIGLPLGALMAYMENSRFDRVTTAIAVLLNSTPYYVVAVILVYILGYQLDIFPTGGAMSGTVTVGPNIPFIVDIIKHATLPVVSLVLTGFGIRALNMRGNSIQILGEEYLRVGRLRGLSTKRLSIRYIGHNAFLPLYTGLMISVGFMFGGAIILESIFKYPGIGFYLYRSVLTRDYPLMMGGFIIITAAVVTLLFIADLTYGWIDPRLNDRDRQSNDGFDVSLISLLKRPFRFLMKSRDSPLAEASTQTNGGLERTNDSVTAGESVFEVSAETTLSRKERYQRRIKRSVVTPLKILWSDGRTRLGASLLVLFVLIGTVGVHLVEMPQPNDGPRLVAPFQTLEFPLGTDGLGQGLLAQIIHGTPAVLTMIFSGALFATTMGTAFGIVSGYVGGKVDRFLMFIADVMLTIPNLPLVIVLVVLLEPQSPAFVGVILAINAWGGLARAIRSEVLSLREDAFVEASRLMGLSIPDIAINDIMSNIMPFVLIRFSNMGRNVLFSSVGLYFLGILPPDTLNWGVILNYAYETGGALYTLDAAHWLIFPMVAIVLVGLAMTMLAQGADRLFNPRIRAKYVDNSTAEADQHEEPSHAVAND